MPENTKSEIKNSKQIRNSNSISSKPFSCLGHWNLVFGICFVFSASCFVFVVSARAAFFPDTGNRAVTGDWDYGGGGLEIENGTTVPGTCTVGQLFLDTDAARGRQLYGCEGGTFVPQLQDGAPSNPVKNAILNPFDDTYIHFGAFSNTWTSTQASGDVFTISSLLANPTVETSLMDLVFTDNNDPDAIFLSLRDNAGNNLKAEFNAENSSLFLHDLMNVVTNAADVNTIIQFNTANFMEIEVGGVEFFYFPAAGGFVGNEGSGTIDYRFESDTDDAVFFLDGSADFVGIGTSTPGETLDVQGDVRLDFNAAASANGICHSGGADIDVAPATDVNLVICNAGSGDIAEWYDTTGAEPGDVVSLTGKTVKYLSPLINARTGEGTDEFHEIEVAVLEKSGYANDPLAIGVISTAPVNVFGSAIRKEANSPQPLALIGRIPVKVNLENGEIRPGDLIAASSAPGIGMKAAGYGWVIGVALEEFDESKRDPVLGYGKIMMFANPHDTGWEGREGRIAEELARAEEETAKLRKEFEVLKDKR